MAHRQRRNSGSEPPNMRRNSRDAMISSMFNDNFMNDAFGRFSDMDSMFGGEPFGGFGITGNMDKLMNGMGALSDGKRGSKNGNRRGSGELAMPGGFSMNNLMSGAGG